jgi:diguanylate cyclase (GGDEF)-like protein
MKRLVSAIAIILAWAAAASAVEPPALTTLRAIHNLSNAEASHVLPVAFEATVTYFNDKQGWLFVQDDGVAIYVHPPKGTSLVPGDRILVRGTTQPGFRPLVYSSSILMLHPGVVPKSTPATFDQLIRGQLDCVLVTVHGVIQTADLVWTSGVPTTRLRLLTDGGYVDANVNSDKVGDLKNLLDAEVEVTGAAAGRFDGKQQQTGALLHVSSPAGVRVLKYSPSNSWVLPITPMGEVLTSYHVKNSSRRVRVRGTITYYQPGSAVVLQSGDKSLWVGTQSIAPLRVGNRATATGFPDVHDGFLALTSAEVEDEQIPLPITPQLEDWRQLVAGRHLYDLVAIEGVVVTAVQGASQDEYALVSDGYMFSAIYRHPEASDAPRLSPMMAVPTGSRVRVTGICILADDKAFERTAFERDVPFNILLRSADDIAIVAKPSWLNIRNLISIVSVLLLVVVAFGGWGWTLRRRVRQQTAALRKRIAAEAALERKIAQLEQRRSQILEAINGSAPLAGILEEIAALDSFRLDGAPCWCEVADGARLGDRPAWEEDLRVISVEIAARNGPALGRLYAGFPPGSQPDASEDEALSIGSKLATLAIETRRLYSDLRHRSEFDLLTDIHNRFSLGKQLDVQIEEARKNARVFGLIYIDLDDFKQVNDIYGHHVGDLYLQEVASRMKGQLRSLDMLARLGGDEFAALVTVVRSRAEVEEIAQRLERCLDEVYAVDGCVLKGSASVGIALYPEDGSTKDSLLNAADAAMYVAKHTKQHLRGDLAQVEGRRSRS